MTLVLVLALVATAAVAQVQGPQEPDDLPGWMRGTRSDHGPAPMFVVLPGTATNGPGAGSDAVVELTHEHVVQPGDSLALLAARYGVSEQEIARRNGLADHGIARPPAAAVDSTPGGHAQAGLALGQRLSILARHVVPAAIERGVIVNIPQRMLYRFEAGRLVGAWPVAVGRPGWETPVTEFRIINRLLDPVWYVPRSVQAEMRREGRPVQTMVDPGPDNPLGGYWLGIDRPGFGLHATNEEDTGYRFASHGCVRLHPDDMAVLFPQLRVGDRGAFIYRTVLLARSVDGRIWLEVNPDAYGLTEESVETVRELARRQALDPADIDWPRVATILGQRSGMATDITMSRQPAGSVRAADDGYTGTGYTDTHAHRNTRGVSTGLTTGAGGDATMRRRVQAANGQQFPNARRGREN